MSRAVGVFVALLYLGCDRRHASTDAESQEQATPTDVPADSGENIEALAPWPRSGCLFDISSRQDASVVYNNASCGVSVQRLTDAEVAAALAHAISIGCDVEGIGELGGQKLPDGSIIAELSLKSGWLWVVMGDNSTNYKMLRWYMMAAWH